MMPLVGDKVWFLGKKNNVICGEVTDRTQTELGYTKFHVVEATQGEDCWIEPKEVMGVIRG
jgi:hypothetical protein